MAKARNRRSRLQSNSKRNRYKLILSSSQVASDVHVAFFYNLSEGEIFNGYGHVRKSKKFSSLVNLTEKGNVNNFYKELIDAVSIEKLLAWAAAIFVDNSEQIRDFHLLEKKIQDDVLELKFDEAMKTLDKIDRKLGPSIWSTSLRAGIIRSAYGDEGYKTALEFASDVFEEESFASKIVKSKISQKFDSAISVSRGKIIRRQITRDFKEPLRSLLNYHIVPRNLQSDTDLDFLSILQFEKQSSLIDFYQAVLAYISHEGCKPGSNKNDVCERFIKRTYGYFSNPIINGLAEKYGHKVGYENLAKEYAFLDLYSEGKYQALSDLAEENNSFVRTFSIFEMVVKAVVRSGRDRVGGGYFEHLLDNLKSLMLSDFSVNSSIGELLYEVDTFYELSWFKELLCYIEKSSKSLPELDARYIGDLSLLLSPLRSPKKLSRFSDDVEKSYKEIDVSESTTAKLIQAFSEKK